MRNTLKLTKAILVLFVLTIFSCSSDDDNSVAQTVINLEDLTTAIDENPTVGQSLGTIQSNVTSALTYSISAQNPTGALSIDASTGELTVLDATLFDFEVNPTITATIEATGVENAATVTINLNNINEIGDYNHGGVVFWIDPTDNTKGLVCAVKDQSTSIIWGDLNAPEVIGTNVSVGSGVSNTDLIIASKGSGTTHAAGVARAYNAGGYSDWSLPSKDELTEIFNNKTIINTTALANAGEIFQEGTALGARYWVSNMSGLNGNFIFNFYTGTANGVWPINARNVRAVRAF